MTIIGLLGKARAGKDLTGKLLRELVPNAQTIALADPIKSIAGKLFSFDEEQLYGKLKEAPDKRYPRTCTKCAGKGKVDTSIYTGNGDAPTPRWENCEACHGEGVVYLTPRWALQYIGTEVARSLYTDVWIDYGIRWANHMLKGEAIRTAPDTFEKGIGMLDCVPLVAFTDVRFINECRKIRENGGVIWRITRPGIEDRLQGQSKTHASEMEQESPEIQQYINTTIANDGTIEDLRLKVAVALAAVLPEQP